MADNYSNDELIIKVAMVLFSYDYINTVHGNLIIYI
jgi:hypothetical protein